MELNRKDWYVGLFFWSLGIWDEFLERDTAWDLERRGTNLCHFVRVIVVYMPLVLFCHLLVLVVALAILISLPIYLFGWIGYAWVVSVIAVIILAPLGIKAVRRSMKKSVENRVSARTARTSYAPITSLVIEPKGRSFWEVLWEFAVAQKKKVCPQITFYKKEASNA